MGFVCLGFLKENRLYFSFVRTFSSLLYTLNARLTRLSSGVDLLLLPAQGALGRSSSGASAVPGDIQPGSREAFLGS